MPRKGGGAPEGQSARLELPGLAWARRDAETRLEVAGELHDGVLQTLTTIGLQLEIAMQLVAADPEGTRVRLAQLAEHVRAEQRELRLFMDELKVESATTMGYMSAPFARDRLSDMLGRLQAAWGVSSDLVMAGDIPPSEMETTRTVLRLVQESGVNSARHGGASHLSVRVTVEPEQVLVVVTDDGQGFRFRGTYSDEELHKQRIGPLSLKRRVHRANGRMSIHSAADGAEITFEIPRTPGADYA